MSFVEKIKKRWNLTSTFQIVIILIVFSVTGFSAVFAKDVVFEILNVSEETSFWVRVLVWLVTILPLYYVFLLTFGTLFGQRSFFWWFTKKSFSRFIPAKKKKTKAP
ncbi:MAG: prolipoprotein diacylglyceryl transferase [Balneolales bacterium]|nr:prolipoprotein diacylglyceryl transferase [Balneolales bacterium]